MTLRSQNVSPSLRWTHLVVDIWLAGIAPNRKISETQYQRMTRQLPVGHHVLVYITPAEHLKTVHTPNTDIWNRTLMIFSTTWRFIFSLSTGCDFSIILFIIHYFWSFSHSKTNIKKHFLKKQWFWLKSLPDSNNMESTWHKNKKSIECHKIWKAKRYGNPSVTNEILHYQYVTTFEFCILMPLFWL